MISAPHRRVVFWEAHLAALISARAAAPFAWGTQDCVTFAADAVQAITGADPIAGIRGTWHDAAGAEAAIAAFFGCPGRIDQATHAMAQRQAWPEVPPALAQRGDLVLVPAGPPSGGLVVPAICTGERAMHPGSAGLVATPMTRAIRAWSI